MTRIYLFGSVLLLLPLLAPAYAATGPASRGSNGEYTLNRPMSPGTEIPGKTLTVRSPNSKDWVLVTSGPYGMVFDRKGAEPGEGDEAQVVVFPLTENESKKKLIDFAKARIAKNMDPKRFALRKSNYRYSKERKYPCVRVDYLAEDKQARTSATTTEKQLLEVHGLFCRHPVRDDIAFAAIYWHRGRKPDPAVQAGAADFIENVQVPGF